MAIREREGGGMMAGMTEEMRMVFRVLDSRTITLRDFFAGCALIAHGNRLSTLGDAKDIATWVFEYADALLKERDA